MSPFPGALLLEVATSGCSAGAIATDAPADLASLAAWFVAGVLFVVAVLWFPLQKTMARAVSLSARIGALQQALDEALARVRQFSESQEHFVGNLAQEIKTPLATLRMHADLLVANGADAAAVERYSRSIAEDLRHLSELVESFLRLVRPIAHQDTSSHVPVHFHDLVVEAVRRCQSLAGTRGVNVVPMLAEPRDHAAIEVLGDEVLLGAMIEDLVRNAVVAAPRGSRVDLRVSTKGEAVILSVCDHGAVIHDVDPVFAGFFQAPPPPRPSPGTGLSLAIAKRVAEHHQGTLSLRNLPEGGCEFAVQLPLWRPERPKVQPRVRPSMPRVGR